MNPSAMARDFDAAIRDYVPLTELVEGHERATRDRNGNPAPLSVAALSKLYGPFAFGSIRLARLTPRILTAEDARALILGAARMFYLDDRLEATTAILVAASRGPVAGPDIASLAIAATTAALRPDRMAQVLARGVARCACLRRGLAPKSRKALAHAAWALDNVFSGRRPVLMCSRMLYAGLLDYDHAPSVVAARGPAAARRALLTARYDPGYFLQYHRAPHRPRHDLDCPRDDGDRRVDPLELRAGVEFVRRRRRAAALNVATFARWRAAASAGAALVRRAGLARRAAGLRA